MVDESHIELLRIVQKTDKMKSNTHPSLIEGKIKLANVRRKSPQRFIVTSKDEKKVSYIITMKGIYGINMSRSLILV